MGTYDSQMVSLLIKDSIFPFIFLVIERRSKPLPSANSEIPIKTNFVPILRALLSMKIMVKRSYCGRYDYMIIGNSYSDFGGKLSRYINDQSEWVRYKKVLRILRIIFAKFIIVGLLHPFKWVFEEYSGQEKWASMWFEKFTRVNNISV